MFAISHAATALAIKRRYRNVGLWRLLVAVQAVELWWLFRGTWGLLAGIVIYNILDIPVLLPNPDAAARIAAHPAILTSFIVFQIVTTWILIYWLARGRQMR